MTQVVGEFVKVDFKNKGKEEFTIELDIVTNELTLTVNGIIRNKIKIDDAESQFDRMLKIAKKKFLMIREIPKIQ